MVKSGTRKKTNDLLVDGFAAFTFASHKTRWREQDCRYQQSAIKTPFLSMGLGCAPPLNLRHGRKSASGAPRRPGKRKPPQAPGYPWARRRLNAGERPWGRRSSLRYWILNKRAETGAGHRAGLSGHGATEPLALERRVEVHFAAGE